jgi:predicted transglutaminase-like cysteine proteinase
MQEATPTKIRIPKPNTLLTTGFLTAFSLMNVGEADASHTGVLPSRSLPAIEAGEAKPIAAWNTFCARFASECRINLQEESIIALSPGIWSLLSSVNTRVNATIRPLTDEEHWGVTDRWGYPEDGAGDCEDYQLLKRKQLVEAGLPRRALRMTVVIDEKGEGHAVLMARTDRGDFILDNKTDVIRSWHETGYIYVKREGQDNKAWISLGGAVSPLMTANP